MEHLEYDNIKVNVPESWDDVTLGDYETFYRDKPTTTRELVDYVAKIVKTPAETLMQWPAGIYNRIVETIQFMFKEIQVPASPNVEIGGVWYRVPMEDELTLGAWVDAEEAQKAGENVLSEVLSIVCRPIGEAYDTKTAEERRVKFAALPVSTFLGVLAFFLQCKDAYEKHTAAYIQLCQLVDLLPRSIKNLVPHMAGTKLSRIWQMVRYWIMIKSLRYQLAKLSRTYNTSATKA